MYTSYGKHLHEMDMVQRIKKVGGDYVKWYIDGKEIPSVYIGRQCFMGGHKLYSSKWANPHKLKDCKDINDCLSKYEKYVKSNNQLMKDIWELDGKILLCWCRPSPCHGDVLLSILRELKEGRSKEIEIVFVDREW